MEALIHTQKEVCRTFWVLWLMQGQVEAQLKEYLKRQKDLTAQVHKDELELLDKTIANEKAATDKVCDESCCCLLTTVPVSEGRDRGLSCRQRVHAAATTRGFGRVHC